MAFSATTATAWMPPRPVTIPHLIGIMALFFFFQMRLLISTTKDYTQHMGNDLKVWIRVHSRKIVNSIAFYPAFIATVFLITSVLMVLFDYSESGKSIKESLHWLSLKDASTARSIVSAIVAGIISLTVFSFSMVMIVLNQAASQLSNRILDNLIGNRFQQIVLGIYIGTIVFALFLLSTIRDIDSGVRIPALSTYLLIIVTIVDIFLFIYFLHYVTQSVKYQVIIERIYRQTKTAMKKTCCLDKMAEPAIAIPKGPKVVNATAGIFEGFDTEALLLFCVEHKCSIAFLNQPGTFLLKGMPVLTVSKELSEDDVSELLRIVYIHSSESIEGNYYYGLRQLVEVAIKALSPGINDPATAILCLRGLFELLSFRAVKFPDEVVKDEDGNVRIVLNNPSFETIFANTILPIWDYGKNDRLLQDELYRLLVQLDVVVKADIITNLTRQVNMKRNEFFLPA